MLGGMSPRRLAAIQAIMVIYRLATAMGPLAILLTLTGRGTLSIAAFALTLWTVACAAAQPLWAWAAGRRQGLTLVVLGVATAAAHVGLAAASDRAAALILATVAGATLPPVTAVARSALGSMLTGDRRERAFGLESALASAAFIAAPLCVGGAYAVALVGPLALCAGLFVATSVGYAIVAAAFAGAAATVEGERDAPGEVPAGAVRSWTLLVAAGGGAYAALACIEVAVVARLEDAGSVAITLAAWSAASLLAGLVLSIQAPRLLGRTVLWALPCGCAALAALSFGGWGGRWAFAATLVVSGVAVAPLLGTLTAEIARRTSAALHRSSYALLQTTSWLGAALGTAVAGLLATRALGALLLASGVLATVAVIAVRRPPAGAHDGMSGSVVELSPGPGSA